MASPIRGPYGTGSPHVHTDSTSTAQPGTYHPPLYLAQAQRYNMQLKATPYGLTGSPMIATGAGSALGMAGGGYGVASSMIAMTPHRQQQLTLQQESRQASTPHHHARLAIAIARRDINLQNAAAHALANGDEHGNARTGEETQNNNNQSGSNSEMNESQRWHAIDLGGMGLRNLSQELFQYTFLTKLYISHNQISYLPESIVQLRSLTVLDASSNNLTFLPRELGLLTELKELLLFDNKLTELPAELGTLYQLNVLGIEGNPIQEPVKSLIYTEGTTAVIAYLRDNCRPPDPPRERIWHQLEAEPSFGDPFTLMSYNILCEKYASSAKYGYTPQWALAWDNRRESLIQEIKSLNADIICLQEIEGGQHEDFFTQHLRPTYESVLWQKSRAKTMENKERRSVDGCATFFRSSIFKLVKHQIIEFNEMAIQRSDFKKSDEIFQRFMTKDNVAGVALLQHLPTGMPLIVANTHIHWDPEYKDVKLVQVGMLMEALENLTTQWLKEFPMPANVAGRYTSASQMPVVAVGDFNSEPTSGVAEFMVKGILRPDHLDFNQQTYGSFCDDGLKHPFQMRSAYADITDMQYTNFTPKFKGIIDYIWYNQTALTCRASLGGVDPEYLARSVGFPDANFPSDHISLASVLCFRNAPTSRNHNAHNNAASGHNSGNSGRRTFTYRK
jgi:CCR4-NOT transcription complex subunit 6